VRLFRQTEHRQWDRVTAEIARALQAEVDAARTTELPVRRRAS